uniref:C2H2-type domain-containing protein n=1 Tax=Angiostrongylus cantonensis TaxID=6313 RepID=A0A0K0CSV0_ANGCA
MKSMSTNGDLKLDCQFCGTSYESISDLQTHTIREHVPMPIPSLECQHCFAVLPSFAAFVIHMRGHLNDREDTRCSRCPLTFSDTQARLLHLVSHFEVRKTLRFCVDCGVSVNDSVSLGQHFIKRHLRLQHLCLICGQTNDTQKEFMEFQEHVMSHSNELVSLECGPCRINFDSHEFLAMHVQLIHDKEQSSDKTNTSTATAERNTTTLNNYNYSAKEVGTG